MSRQSRGTLRKRGSRCLPGERPWLRRSVRRSCQERRSVPEESGRSLVRCYRLGCVWTSTRPGRCLQCSGRSRYAPKSQSCGRRGPTFAGSWLGLFHAVLEVLWPTVSTKPRQRYIVWDMMNGLNALLGTLYCRGGTRWSFVGMCSSP